MGQSIKQPNLVTERYERLLGHERARAGKQNTVANVAQWCGVSL